MIELNDNLFNFILGFIKARDNEMYEMIKKNVENDRINKTMNELANKNKDLENKQKEVKK